MEFSDQFKGSQSLNDIMYRRLKNRERQRRYRERKRLQADASEACVSKHPSQLQVLPVPVQTNGTAEQVVTRVHCVRDWKKDARRVLLAKQEAMCNVLSSSGQSSAGENRPLGVEQSLVNEGSFTSCSHFDNHEKVRSRAGRRDWKAEARNKNHVLSVTKSVLLHSG